MTAAQFQRNLKDNNLVVTKALPAAAASNSSSSINLGSNPGLLGEKVELVFNLPATPALVDTKKVTVTLEDSADDSSFAAITGLSTVVATGAGGAGAAAIERRLRLPSGVRSYIRFSTAVESGGGDNTGVTAEMSLRA